MVGRRVFFGISAFLLPILAACQTAPAPRASASHVWKSVPPSIQVPASIERLAILYPKTYIRELMEAYARLEGATFQLKEQRPVLRIIERASLQHVLDEQRFQFAGGVSEETAIRLGRLLGVDSILLYRIETPSLRDRLVGRLHRELPPVLVTSKVILVETAEVVFYNVVSSSVDPDDGEIFQRRIRAALERGIAQTIADLWHAFR
jgi:hypothetical protein